MLAIPTFAEGNEILTPTSCTIEISEYMNRLM